MGYTITRFNKKLEKKNAVVINSHWMPVCSFKEASMMAETWISVNESFLSLKFSKVYSVFFTFFSVACSSSRFDLFLSELLIGFHDGRTERGELVEFCIGLMEILPGDKTELRRRRKETS